MDIESILAERLGVTTHLSPLRMKLDRLMREYPIAGAEILEDWLLDVANSRGVTAVSRSMERLAADGKDTPPGDVLSNAELITAICQPHNRDRPQWLRAAAQLITKGDFDLEELLMLAERERGDRILAELASQALRPSPGHAVWQTLLKLGEGKPPLRDSLVHWTRLAEPVMRKGKPGAEEWRLVG